MLPGEYLFPEMFRLIKTMPLLEQYRDGYQSAIGYWWWKLTGMGFVAGVMIGILFVKLGGL